jgi:hypothetical protein
MLFKDGRIDCLNFDEEEGFLCSNRGFGLLIISGQNRKMIRNTLFSN